ncbi:hypothetical protein D3C80_2189860 [compost metagenome]
MPAQRLPEVNVTGGRVCAYGALNKQLFLAETGALLIRTAQPFLLACRAASFLK